MTSYCKHGGTYAVCGECHALNSFVWNDSMRAYTLPRQCVKCDWQPTRYTLDENKVEIEL